MPGTGPRAVVFDVGGVLIRWDDQQVMDRAAELLQVPVEGLHERLLRYRPPLQSGRIDLDGFWVLIAREIGRPVPRKVRELWWKMLEQEAQPRWGVIRWAARLRDQGIQTPLFSNTDASHRPFFAQAWSHGFSPQLLSYELGTTKPHPLAFRRAQRTLGIPPADLALVDDVAANVEAARNQDWNAHLFRDLAGARKFLLELGWISPTPTDRSRLAPSGRRRRANPPTAVGQVSGMTARVTPRGGPCGR